MYSLLISIASSGLRAVAKLDLASCRVTSRASCLNLQGLELCSWDWRGSLVLKHAARSLLYLAVPRWAAAIMSARSRRHSHRLLATWGYTELNEKLTSHLGRQVVGGPFADMLLTSSADAEHLGPFLLGVYESELDGAWARVFRREYTQILDIGAKFGYYAVGLARRYPRASVVAFDPDRWARKALREMISANHVLNVRVERFCSADWLVRNLHPSAFIMSDCEGYESQLFVPRVLATLRGATLLIEVHEDQARGITARLEELFSATHSVQVLGTDSPRRAPDVSLSFLTEEEQRLATHEIRGPQAWLLCLPSDRAM